MMMHVVNQEVGVAPMSLTPPLLLVPVVVVGAAAVVSFVADFDFAAAAEGGVALGCRLCYLEHGRR